MKKLMLTILPLCFGMNALAGDIHNAKIVNIMMDKSYGERVYIELDKDLVPRDTECHTSSRWEYVLDTSTTFGEKLYSNLLVLYSTQNPAKFFGTGSCLHTGIEELRRIEMLN